MFNNKPSNFFLWILSLLVAISLGILLEYYDQKQYNTTSTEISSPTRLEKFPVTYAGAAYSSCRLYPDGISIDFGSDKGMPAPPLEVREGKLVYQYNAGIGFTLTVAPIDTPIPSFEPAPALIVELPKANSKLDFNNGIAAYLAEQLHETPGVKAVGRHHQKLIVYLHDGAVSDSDELARIRYCVFAFTRQYIYNVLH